MSKISRLSKIGRLTRLARIVRHAYETMYSPQGDLAGACFDASHQLFRLAIENKLPVEIGFGESHAFVLLGDTVVDVTATQFGVRRKVLVAKLKQMKKRRWHGLQPWDLQERHGNIRSANRVWGYKYERRMVLKTLRKEGY